MIELVVGVDCSTTACKACAWDRNGIAVAEGRSPLSLSNPEPDGWEQDAGEWWLATASALRSMMARVDPLRQRVVALCITHQRETVVLTDRSANPVHPALVWMDARCRSHVRSAVAELSAERLHAISGKPPSTTPSLYKLLYLRDRHPELFAATPCVLDVHALLSHRLTGELRTSLASADPLGLVDLTTRQWSPELLALLGLGLDQLAELAVPGTRIGSVTAAAAAETGLPSALPVYAGAGDGQCAALGAGVTGPSSAYLNLGTAIVSGVVSPEYRRSSAFRTLFAAAPDGYLLESDLKGGTFTLNWLIEKWLRPGGATLGALEQQAAELAPGSEGLLLVPYWAGVMNPYWDDDATGITVGWTGEHTPAHFYRAVLEGIAFEQRLAIDGIETATGTSIDELLVLGGGAQSGLWCQILADVLGKTIVLAEAKEATALGAGMLAAVGVGWYRGVEEATAAMTRRGRSNHPGQNASAYNEWYAVYRELYPTLRASLARVCELRSRRAT